MSEWKEVPAWEALKALQEGTHEVQWRYEQYERENDRLEKFAINQDIKHRIRPKARTVNVIGFPVPVQVPNPYAVLGDYWCVPLHYDTKDKAVRATAPELYEALEALTGVVQSDPVLSYAKGSPYDKAIKDAIAVLKKARGE